MTPALHTSVSKREAARHTGVTLGDIEAFIGAGKVAVYRTTGGHARVEVGEVLAEKRARSERREPKPALSFDEMSRQVARGVATWGDFAREIQLREEGKC